MKKTFFRALIMSMVTFSSIVLLVACSNQKSESSSERKTETSQVTKSIDTKASSKSSGSKSASSSNQIKGPDKPSVPSSSSSSSSKASSSQKAAPKASESQPKAEEAKPKSEEAQSQVEVDMDVNAVARGQYDSIMGTWKANDGSLLIFDKSTLVGVVNAQRQATSHNYVVSKGDYKDGSGKYEATLSTDNGNEVTHLGDVSFVSKKAAVSGPSYEQDTIQVTLDGVTRVYFKESAKIGFPSDVTVTDQGARIPQNSGIAQSGTYQLTQKAIVKNEPSASAPIVFYLEAGYKINYDMKLTADGHTWLSYISYSGVRRYVQID